MRPVRSSDSITFEIGLKELQALVCVADLGSFRRAATELGFTQSALSHQVATLENKLGHQLFVRPGGRGGVKLTVAGEAACRRARRTLSEARAMFADIEESGGAERAQIRVGVTQTIAAEIMPPALREFREVHPAVEVTLSEVDGDEVVLNGLGSGKFDLGFVNTQAPDERVEMLPVTEDRWVILTRRGSALSASERPGLDVLDGADLVAWTRRWRAQRELEDILNRRGIVPRIAYRTDDNLALQRLVAAGLGDACVGELSVLRAVDASLTWLVPADALGSHPIVLCHPRGQTPRPAVSTLIAAIRAQAPRPAVPA
ncbi:MAG: LysR family transcriptional regulator [Solirubrobacterales bacterium]|nr:LysR family transcriptional regulator [Solirubrobacterales bacterium]